MYHLLGADGKEYGPVNGDVLRQWITQGRANAQSKVKPEGSAEWQLLVSVPEFQADFAANPPIPPFAARHPAVGALSNLSRPFLKNNHVKGSLCIEL